MQGWVLPRQKVYIFARTVEKPVKTTEKMAKTGNKFSTLNWMEILRCNYNASLKLS